MIWPSSAGTGELGMVPVAPASRSGINVTDSSPSKGPGRALPRALTSACSLSAACGTSILAYCTWGTCRTRSISRLTGSGVDDVRHLLEVLDHRGPGNGERGAEERRHDHHHRRSHVLRGAAALGGDPGAVMAGGDDHREPSRDPLEERAGDRVAFGVGQRELLGVVG